nr:glycosyltransferase [Pontibacter sp. 172403-2]
MGCKKLRQIVREENIQMVIAHGAPAGAVAEKALKGIKLPYYVTSLEPHANYMLQSKVWSRHGLKYKFQKRWENLQKKNAAGLMPVSGKYKAALIREGVTAENIFVVPCSVDADMFRFNKQQRNSLRQQLGWQDAVIGIYVGKYGGLYYKEEAFAIYKQCFSIIPGFRLIILSPHPQAEIIQLLNQQQIDISKVYIASVAHGQVPPYLSAADFAFATIKSYPSARFCSPVKIGEYWANGLPVLLTAGVGDDSDIIQNEGGGALFNLQQEGSVERALEKIQAIISNPEHRREIPKLAAKYRSPRKIKEAYTYFFSRMEKQV